MDTKWKKSSPKLIEAFERVLPQVAGVEKRKMFGYPCAFVNDIWFIGCHQENDLVLRLSDQDRKAFLTLHQAHQFEPMLGRPLKEFVVIPLWMLDDDAQLRQ